LNSAYSRSREYTCDNIGCALAPQGAVRGLLLLGAGKKLYKQISVEQLLASGEHNKGFATGFVEVFSTHPHLLKRIEAVREQLGDDAFAFDKQYVSPHIKETYSSEQL
jgi:Zn-dependent protease with chaperone function